MFAPKTPNEIPKTPIEIPKTLGVFKTSPPLLVHRSLCEGGSTSFLNLLSPASFWGLVPEASVRTAKAKAGVAFGMCKTTLWKPETEAYAAQRSAYPSDERTSVRSRSGADASTRRSASGLL